MKRLIVVLLVAALAGCAGMTNEEKGALTGAIVLGTIGILTGNALDCQGCAAIGGTVGTIGGAAIGGNWGRELDRLDRQNINHALEHQRSGQALAWSNPDSGARHYVVAKPATAEQGTYCREWTDNVTIAGKQQQLYGKACRQPDGNWKLVQ